MNAIRRTFRKLSILFGRDRFHNDLDEEMAFHREQAARELVTGGMSKEEAQYAAARRFGNATGMRERSVEVVGFRMESVLQDARFALRQMGRNPGFAATAIVILGLGIASSVAIFAFVERVLIKPLPYKDPTRIAVLYESIPIGPYFHLSYPDYLDWKRENKVFSSLDVFTADGFILSTNEGRKRVDGATVSDGFFRTLGVTPILGRDFYSGEDGPNAGRATLISYRMWQQRFGGKADVLGKSVELDGNAFVVIGVLPRSFSFAPAEPADFWVALKRDYGCGMNRGCHMLFGIARLKDGVTFATAMADVKSIAQQLEKQYPDSNRDQVGLARPLTEVVDGDIKPILLVALCGAGLLMLIASINVASLLLVRAENRRREMAVRGALGASPQRLVRQYVTEGFLLAAIGGALGVGCAHEGMRLLSALVPKDMVARMPYLEGLALNLRVLGFAAVLILLAGALFAAIPISRAKFTEIRGGLSEGGRGAAGVVWRRIGSNLVVIELATAMVLLAGAGLLGKSFYRLLHTDIGIEPDHIATLRVNGETNRYEKNPEQLSLARAVLARVKSLPGVKSVGLTTRLPLGDGDGTRDFHIVGRPYHGEHNEVAFRNVSAGYMETLQTRLIGGRYFRDDEDASKPGVVIVNQAVARQYYGGDDPVGSRISFDDSEKNPLIVVGVVNDIQEGQLDARPRGAIYRPLSQDPNNAFSVVVRTAQDEDSLLPAMSAAIREIDPALAVYEPITMAEKIHDGQSTYLHRSSAWLVGGFAALALLLGVVGLYGVVAYSVSQRTREIGVRMALGAQRSTVCGLVMREAGRLIVVGVLLGMAGAVPSALLMRGLLFGVSAWDLPTLAGVATVLAVAALAASYLPARRAASVSPAEALRAE